jgi:hypothetical protein
MNHFAPLLPIKLLRQRFVVFCSLNAIVYNCNNENKYKNNIMKTLSLKSALLVLITLVGLAGCRKSESDTEQLSPSIQQTIRATVAGTVVDESNKPLAGVKVEIDGQSTTTDFTGTFLLNKIYMSASRCAIKFSSPGYYMGVKCFTPKSDRSNFVKVVLIKKQTPYIFNTTSGITIILPNGTTIILPANGYVTATGSTYSGMVNATVYHLTPDDPDFGLKIPGGDLLGIDRSGNKKVLQSYGMINVELTDNNGNQLQIAPGKTATLKYAIALSQLSSAPNTMPHWFYNEKTNLWNEEGAITRNGNFYETTVSHFTWWNCDYPYGLARIQGQVLFCNNVPAAFVLVTFSNGYVLTTDMNGQYDEIFPANLSLTFQVLASNNNGVINNSPIVTIPALSIGQIYSVPDLIIPCPTFVKGRVTDCSGNLLNNAQIRILWNGGVNYGLSSNGYFEVPVPSNANVNILINHIYALYEQNDVQTSTVDLNLGNVELCNNYTNQDNLMTLTGNGLDGTYLIDTITTEGYINIYPYDIIVTGKVVALNIPFLFKFSTSGNLQIGTYNFLPFDTTNFASIYFGNHYIISWGSNSQCYLKIIDIGPVGGYIYFETGGNYIEYDASNIPQLVNVSNMRFKVKRLQ